LPAGRPRKGRPEWRSKYGNGGDNILTAHGSTCCGAGGKIPERRRAASTSFGGAGNDTLNGGSGSDWCRVTPGNDTLILTSTPMNKRRSIDLL
jgi:Ca2+-binding RTX toxin-like protein